MRLEPPIYENDVSKREGGRDLLGDGDMIAEALVVSQILAQTSRPIQVECGLNNGKGKQRNIDS